VRATNRRAEETPPPNLRAKKLATSGRHRLVRRTRNLA